MATLGQAKTLGGVGSILALLGFIPEVGWIIAIIGFILVLFAVKYIADVIGNQKVFNDMIIAVVCIIIGFVVFFVVVAAAVLSLIGLSPSITPGQTPTAAILADVGVILAGLVVLWVFFLISSIFIRRSYDIIATRLNVGMFHTTGLLYLIGAATSIIVVGFLIVLIAEILQIVAFFSLPEQAPMAPQPTPGQWTQPPPAGTV